MSVKPNARKHLSKMKDEIREVKEDIRGTLHEIAETFKPQVIIDEKKCEACERSEKLTGHNPTFPLIWASVDQERENVLSAGTDTPAPAWYHVTNNQFPFKSKYVWCKAKNEFEDASLTAEHRVFVYQYRLLFYGLNRLVDQVFNPSEEIPII